MATGSTIIVGHIDDKELEASIDQLIKYIDEGSTKMAKGFDNSLNLMTQSMTRFATENKKNLSVIKSTFQDFSTSFGAMATAMTHSASRGGHGTSGYTASDAEGATLGQLEAQKKELEALRRATSESSAEMLRLTKQVEEMKKRIKSIKTERFSMSEVMGMPEKTLDDVALKMKAIRTLQGQMDSKQQGNDIRKLSDEYVRLGKAQKDLIGQNTLIDRQTRTLSSAFGYLRNRIIYAFTIGAITNFVKQLYEIRGQYELLERSLGVLINDMGKGTQIFNELNAMALQSPFTMLELGTAAKQLTAYNFQANEVVDTTRRLADISAALGVPIERLVYNLGQIKAQTVLNARDARDFANAGLAIVPMLAQMYTEQKRFGDEVVTTAQVYDMMTKKMVSYADVMQVITGLTDEGGKFFDFQAKQADTLRVQIANLSLAYNNMLNEIGGEQQSLLSGIVRMIRNGLENWHQVVRVMKTLTLSTAAYYLVVKNLVREEGRLMTAGALRRMTNWVKGLGQASTAAAGLGKALTAASTTPIGLASTVAVLASIVGYLLLFNRRGEETRRRLKEIDEGFESIRNTATGIWLEALKADTLERQLEGVKKIIDLANDELGVVIPVNLEDVDETNIKEKIQEVSRRLDDYLDFAQIVSEKFVSNRADKRLRDFGLSARSTFTSVGGAVRTVTRALEELKMAGDASNHEIELLGDIQRRENESQYEYLQRIIHLYEELGLLPDKQLKELLNSTIDPDIVEHIQNQIEEQQNLALKRMGITHKRAFTEMTDMVLEYDKAFSKASKAIDDIFDKATDGIADWASLPKDEKQIRIEGAINKIATEKNWNEWTKEFARDIANKKFGVEISLSTDNDSGKDAEEQLVAWQKRLKQWAEDNGITLGITLTMQTTEVDAANEALNNVRKAYDAIGVIERKIAEGTASQEDLDKAKKYYEERVEVARKAGADLTQLNKQTTDTLAESLKQEISLIKDVQSNYEKLKKAGVDNMTAIDLATQGYEATLGRVNEQLSKYGLEPFNTRDFAGKDVNQLLTLLTGQRAALVASGKAPTTSLEALDMEIQRLRVDAKTYNMEKITKGLNNELSKLHEQYEMSVEMEANPVLGDMIASMFDIDTSSLPHTIDDYVARVQDAFDEAVMNLGKAPMMQDILKVDIKKWAEEQGIDASDTFIKDWTQMQDVVRKTTKDWYDNIYKQTTELEYRLADTNGKIAIQESKIADLRTRLAAETNEKMRYYLELRIKEEEEALATLQEDILQMLPFYQNLFGKIADHSARLTQQLTKEALKILSLDEGGGTTNNNDGTYTIRDGNKQVTVTAKQYERLLDKVNDKARDTRGVFEKIVEAIKEGEDGLVDWWKAIDLIGDEMGHLSEGFGLFSEVMESLGTDGRGAEIFKDIENTMKGLSGVVKGLASIQSGDPIGGAVSMLKGAWEIIGTWSDNANNAIDREVAAVERRIDSLKVAYTDLSNAMDDAYGTGVLGAQRLAIANKELQLIEMERQLTLERSRRKKHQDKAAMLELEESIIQLKHEIASSVADITNSLLGISSVADAAESAVYAMIQAYRKGEDYMESYEKTFEDMIDRMIAKSIASEVIGNRIQSMWDYIQSVATKRADASFVNDYIEDFETRLLGRSGSQDRSIGGVTFSAAFTRLEDALSQALDRGDDAAAALIREQIETIMEAYSKIATPGLEDIQNASEQWQQWKDEDEATFKAIMDMMGIKYGGADASLSALQQGIKGMTETQAGALEAYWNANTQQQYVHTDLLMQIRDTINGMGVEAHTAVTAQILLQLQNCYQVQASIQSILRGWSSANGLAVRVELQ